MTTVQSTTATPAPEAEPASEFGATVQDAQRLLRRAARCYVFFHVSSKTYGTGIIEIPKRAIATQLKRMDALAPFPVELEDQTLTIGGSAAVSRAERSRQ